MIAICLVCLLLVLGSYLFGWAYGLPVAASDSKMAVFNTVVSVASLVVVSLAGIVAILAYQIASGTPKLTFELQFPFSRMNAPSFRLDAVLDVPHTSPWRRIAEFKQTDGILVLKNESRYTARNPGVRIKFQGFVGIPGQNYWQTTTHVTSVGVTEIQWDGGTDHMIHGEWSRTLPTFSLLGASLLPDEQPKLIVTVVADGVSPASVELPVLWEEPETA